MRKKEGLEMYGVNWFEILLWICVIGVFAVPFIDRVLQRRIRMRTR